MLLAMKVMGLNVYMYIYELTQIAQDATSHFEPILRHPHRGSRGLRSASGFACQADGEDRDRAGRQLGSSVRTERWTIRYQA